MKNISYLLIFGVLFVSAACQNPDSATKPNQATNSVAGQTINSAANNPAVAPEQARNSAASAPVSAQTLSLSAPDGALIVGTFYAAGKENSPAVLMLHQFGSNRESYRELAGQFQKNGIAVLAIDGRGFGDSTSKQDGSRIAPSQSAESVVGMKSDVAAALKFLSEQKTVDQTRIGIIGASYGSSLAIIQAADNPAVKSVALLSPGTNYFGSLPTMPAVEKYGARPLLIVAAEDDEESAAAARKLDQLATGDRHQLQIYGRGGHGTAILQAGVGLDKSLLEFFEKNL